MREVGIYEIFFRVIMPMETTKIIWTYRQKIILFFFFCLFGAAPVAYGGSQARDLIRAIAAGLPHSHSHTRSEPRLWHHSSGQCWILNPLSEARDGTGNLMVLKRIRIHCTTMGTPGFLLCLFPVWLPWLGLPKLCWIKVVRVDLLVMFLILAEMLYTFQHWQSC